MIQYYLDLEKQVKSISDIRLTHGQIQKIYSTAFFISIAVRTPGKTWHLYLGRGNGQEGVWIHDSAPPSELRRKDNFLEYLRRHLSSCSFIDLELDPKDRIIRIDYQKFGKRQSILFFWKARKFYFLHYYQDAPEEAFKLLLSWRGKAIIPGNDLNDLYDYFNEVGRREDMDHDLSAQRFLGIDQLLEDEVKAASLVGLSSSPTFLQRKIDNIENDLRRTKQWSQLQKMLDRGDSLDMYELKVGDHKIKFEGELNPYERRNLLFQKIKKLKRGEGILGERLENAREQLKGKPTGPKKSSTLPIVKPVWGKEETKTEATTSRAQNEEYKIFQFHKCSIGVGLSTSGNDQLRSKWASKEDQWLHLDGVKSAHVIVKMKDNQLIDPDTLNLASTILAQFSHFNDDWVPIIHTQVKNLKGVTGAPGMVIYKKEKHLKCLKVNLEEHIKEAL